MHWSAMVWRDWGPLGGDGRGGVLMSSDGRKERQTATEPHVQFFFSDCELKITLNRNAE